MVMAFLQQIHVCMSRIGLHIYNRIELGQNLEKKSMELMFEYLIENQIFLNLFDWKNLLNLEILVPLIWACPWV